MEELVRLKNGIIIDDVKCLPLKVKIKKRDKYKESDLVEIVLNEGRNHIVKKLFSAINHEVIKLTRIKYGFLEMDQLKSGDYRYLSKDEVKKLYNYKKFE